LSDAEGFGEEGFEGVGCEHGGGVAEGFFGLRMNFEEESVGAGGDCCEGEGRGHVAFAAAAVCLGSRLLDAVGGVEEYGAAELSHFGDCAHVVYEVVVAEGCAALCEDDSVVAGFADFFADVEHVVRGHELGFFDVDGFPGAGGGDDEVRLAREECGDLEAVERLGGGRTLVGQVDVAEYGDVELVADLFEYAQSFIDPGAAEGVYGGAVGFVV